MEKADDSIWLERSHSISALQRTCALVALGVPKHVATYTCWPRTKDFVEEWRHTNWQEPLGRDFSSTAVTACRNRPKSQSGQTLLRSRVTPATSLPCRAREVLGLRAGEHLGIGLNSEK